MSFRPAILCSALALAALADLSAQTAEPAQTGTIRGVVRGDMSVIIREADVFLDGETIHVRSGPNGRFRFEGVPVGQHWLYVRAIGYTATRRMVDVAPGENPELTLRLTPAPFALPDVEVTAEADREVRRLMGWTMNAWGYSVSEDQIRKFGNLGLSVIVRTRLRYQAVSGFDLARRDVIAATEMDIYGRPYGDRSWYGAPLSPGEIGVTRPLTGSGRVSSPFSLWGGRSADWSGSGLGVSAPRPVLGSGCPPAVSINGEKPWSETRVDDIPPTHVASMEIYEPKHRGGVLPADFATYGQAASCGLVVIWLR